VSLGTDFGANSRRECKIKSFETPGKEGDEDDKVGGGGVFRSKVKE
jgi:hypothetical protein